MLVLAFIPSCSDDTANYEIGLDRITGLYNPSPVFFSKASDDTVKLFGAHDGKVFEYTPEVISFEYTHSGITYPITLTKYNSENGSICVGSKEKDSDDSILDSFDPSWSADPLGYDKTMIYLDIPMRHRYPLLYDNVTGEITDFLDGVHTTLLYMDQVILSSDNTKVLIFCDDDTEIYYEDLVTKEIYYISDLTGIKNINGAMWMDNESIALMRTSTADPFSPEVEVFEFNTSTGEHEITLQQSSKYHEESGKFMGVILFDGHYGVIAYSGGSTASIDFKTGYINPIDNYTFESDGDIAQTTYENGTHLICRHTDKFSKEQTVAIIDLTTGKEIKSTTIPSKYKTVMYVDEECFAASTGSAEFEQEYVIFPFD